MANYNIIALMLELWTLALVLALPLDPSSAQKESKMQIQMFKVGNYLEKQPIPKKQRKTVKEVSLLDKSKTLKKEIVYK